MKLWNNFGNPKETRFYLLDGVILGAYNPASRSDIMFYVFAKLLFDIVDLWRDARAAVELFRFDIRRLCISALLFAIDLLGLRI